MHRVLVVCGAGASSTFLAHRIRAAAGRREIDVTVSASSTAGLSERLGSVDVLLVGPHLAQQFDELSKLAHAAGSACALLPDTIFGSGGEETALDLVLNRVSDTASSS